MIIKQAETPSAVLSLEQLLKKDESSKRNYRGAGYLSHDAEAVEKGQGEQVFPAGPLLPEQGNQKLSGEKAGGQGVRGDTAGVQNKNRGEGHIKQQNL